MICFVGWFIELFVAGLLLFFQSIKHKQIKKLYFLIWFVEFDLMEEKAAPSAGTAAPINSRSWRRALRNWWAGLFPWAANAFKFNQLSISFLILKEKRNGVDEFDWRAALNSSFTYKDNSFHYWFIFISSIISLLSL